MDINSLPFTRTMPNQFSTWPHALRRQFVVTRRARSHVELEDRKKMPLDPEHTRLAEDWTGKRHSTRDIAEEERFGLIIALVK